MGRLFDQGVVVARWKALPEGLDPAVVQFVAELRRLKDGTGLSVVQVADRTGYSEASWQRYFGGRGLAPREAVEKLVELAGAEATTVSALQDAAQEAWKSAGSTTPSVEAAEELSVEEPESSAPKPESQLESQPESQPESASRAVTTGPQPVRGWIPDARTVLTSAISAVVGAAVTLSVTQPWSTTAVAAPAFKPAEKAPASYHCTYKQFGGKWYAGESTTSSDLVRDGDDGPEVAEVQCLLDHAGISAGGVDGQFGPLTLHAVIQEQMAHHIDVDGQVGPQTWAALRG